MPQSARQTGRAERVAAELRERIRAGRLRAGEQLSEEKLALDLGASRNTLREGFRLLAQERLVVHELNRGVRVRRLGPSDVIDLYTTRRIIEGGALLNAGFPIRQPRALGQMHDAVEAALAAAEQDDWLTVGTANSDFHISLTGLAGSPRLTGVAQQMLAEQRLTFAVIDDLRAFHEPYLGDNRTIVEAVTEGRVTDALAVLMEYLNAAEQQVLEALTRYSD